jgi:hypothetical protein
MKRQTLATIFFALLLALGPAALAADDKDTDTRLVGARLVEVCETRISVITRTNVEHVIAVDGAGTKVRVGDRVVRLGELQTGDVVTVELDEANPVKFANDIQINVRAAQQSARKP